MSDDEKVALVRDSHGRLKGDETPPQNGIILAAAIMTVLTLFSLKYVFDSYLDASNINVRRMHIDESHASEVLTEYRTHSSDQLREGPMTITQAMTQFATRPRDSFPQIRPVAGDTNTGPREGWAAMPVVAGEPAPHAQAQAPAEVPAPAEAPTAVEGVQP